ncbi:hypothetical protein LK996_16555, partial [Lysobacter sp. A6]
ASHPPFHDACVLPRRKVRVGALPTGKQVRIRRKVARFGPRGQFVAGRRTDLELDGALGLAVDDAGARRNLSAMGHIAHMEPNQVTCPELAIDG